MSSTDTRKSDVVEGRKARGAGRRLLSKAYRGITSPVRLLPDFIIIGGKNAALLPCTTTF